MKHFIYLLGVVLTLATVAHAATPIKVETENGTVIAGSNSYRTLYIHQRDTGGVPTCYDECAKQWPPHLAEYWDEPDKPGGTFTIVDRKDGKKQWAKNGMPLYFAAFDEKKGDTNGDGVDDVWKVARP